MNPCASSLVRNAWRIALLAGLASSAASQGFRLIDLTDQNADLSAITADGRYGVFTITSFAPGRSLHGVALDGVGEPVLLAPNVLHHQLAPRGRDVFFLDADNLWRVPADGGQPPAALHPDVPFGQGALSFVISPDGERLVFLADLIDNDFSLFSVPSDGSAPPFEIDGPLTLHASSSPVTQYVFSPDGSRIIFAVPRAAGLYDLYSVPSDGSAAPVQLHGLTNNRTIQPIDLQVSATGRVVYLASVGGRWRVHSVPLDGSAAPVLLGGPAQSQSDVAEMATRISPDGTRVVYRSNEQVLTKQELFSVPIDGSTSATKLNSQLPSGGNVENASPRTHYITPDGARVVYRADQEANDVFQLYSVPIAGGVPPTRLNDPLPVDPFTALTVGDVEPGFLVGADGRVVYRADQAQDQVFELYSVPASGSAPPLRLNPSFDGQEHRDVFEFRLGVDGKTVLYVSNQETLWTRELHGVPSDGSRRPTWLSPVPPPDANANNFIYEYSTRAGRVLFVTDLDDFDDEPYLSFLPRPFRSAERP